MEITMINQTDEACWMQYETDIKAIAEKTVRMVDCDQEACAALIFVTSEKIHEINRDYRNIDRPTDVISFALHDSEDAYEMMEGEQELGDIFINVSAIVEQAAAYGHSQRREVCFLFTHGLLHLLGYDHIDEQEEKTMFHLQEVILNDIVSK